MESSCEMFRKTSPPQTEVRIKVHLQATILRSALHIDQLEPKLKIGGRVLKSQLNVQMHRCVNAHKCIHEPCVHLHTPTTCTHVHTTHMLNESMVWTHHHPLRRGRAGSGDPLFRVLGSKISKSKKKQKNDFETISDAQF